MGKNLERIEAEITLKDNGFTDAINRVNKRTSEYKKSAEGAGNTNTRLAQSFRSAAQGIAVVDGPLGGVASRVSSTASLINGASLTVVGFGAAFAGAALVIGKAISAGEQMERQLYKQEAVLRATGYAAGWNAEQLDKMARDTAYATLASVEDIREAQNVMLTFRKVQGDIFEEAVGLTQDLAVVMGGTASSNAKMLGRALQDPITGVTALTRAGVTFSIQQKEVIKDMVETGREAEAQRLILAELQKQVGGVGAGEAQGLSGSIDTLGQKFQTLLENIDKTTGAGSLLSKIVLGWSGIFGVAADALADTEEEVNARLSALFMERLTAQQNYDNATNQRQRSAAKARLDAIDQEMQTLTAAQKEGAEKQVDAYWQGVETRKQLQDEAAAEQLAKQQTEGAKSIASLDVYLQTQQEKIQKNYDERIAALNSLVLSEEDVQSRGFNSLAELRIVYSAKVEEQYRNQLQALNDKLAAEQLAKDEAARRDEERRQAEQAREDARTQAIQNRAAQVFDSVQELHAAMFMEASDYEDRRYQNTLDKLEAHKQAVKERNAWSLEQETEYQTARQDAAEIHAENMERIQEAEHKARIDAQRNFANIFVAMADSNSKALAAIGKAAAIYNIGIDTYEGAVAAYNAMVGIPYVGPALGVAAAGAVIAFGAEQAANVAGHQLYHTGGIAGQPADNYGARLKSGEINATLMKGEEIITADDPRHRNNLQVYESGNYGASNVMNNSVTVQVDASGTSDPAAVGQQVAQQVDARMAEFSRTFDARAVRAVSRHAKQNSGRIKGLRQS